MSANVKIDFEQRKIETYEPKESMKLPMFFEKKPYQGASGKLYPLQFTDSLNDEKTEKEYTVGVLENEYIRVEVLPEIGGKISRGWDKIGKYDFIYHNRVIKPAMIGLAGPWCSGGIEFNWPQHHRPTTFCPLEYSSETSLSGEKTIWMGEVEPFQHMKGMVGISVEPGRSYIKAKVRIENRTSFAHPFMWWANLAVGVNESYQIVFPPDVEYVNDHDRRAVVSWPIAKGVYETARPFDYGEGTDLSWYPSVKVPTSFMVSEGQSDMDFVSGYDHGRQKGIVAFADHAIATGKKLFHWGDSDFGNMWAANLTDSDGPYVELMTGVYTDNQPDFSWIAPQETKTFEQYWYPIRDIKAVKNATKDAAVNLEKEENTLFAGIQVTGAFPNSTVVITYKGEKFFRKSVDLSADKSWTIYKKIDPSADITDYAITVNYKERELVSFTYPQRGKKKPITPREPVKRPKEIETTEELYINGLHLEQYKQHNWDPLDYYFEAIRRDPHDIRSNTSIGRIYLKRGRFEESLKFFDQALERKLSRNQHPSDTEAFYLKGLALKHLNRAKEAKKLFSKALWNYSYRSAAYLERAKIKAKEGNIIDAIADIDTSLATNSRSCETKVIKAILLRKADRKEEALTILDEIIREDPLSCAAYVEKYLCTKDEEYKNIISTRFAAKARNLLYPALTYMALGYNKDAFTCVQMTAEHCLIAEYYKLMADPNYVIDTENTTICNPSQLEEIAILLNAQERLPHSPEPSYMLGNIFYHNERYREAIEQWKKAITIDDTHAYSYRNLAIAYFDKLGDKRAARICMERAFDLDKDPRIFYELQQLLKNSDTDDDYRMNLYQTYQDIMEKRDDMYLDYIILLTKKNEFEKAIKLMNSRTFHIYEGGEGKITKHHGWMYTLKAIEHLKDKDIKKALASLDFGTIIPKTYGEAKSWFAQEAHLYYYKAKIEKDEKKKEELLKEASKNPSAISEISIFRALALQELSQFDEAQKVLQEMIEKGEDLIANCDRRSYFGVGATTPMPFEYDHEKINKTEGHILKSFALLALGERQRSKEEIDKATKLSPNDFRIFVYHQIKDNL